MSISHAVYPKLRDGLCHALVRQSRSGVVVVVEIRGGIGVNKQWQKVQSEGTASIRPL